MDSSLQRATALAPVGLLIFAVFATLSLAQSVFAPTLTALVLGVVFSPLAEFGTRIGLPRVAVAMLILLAGIVTFMLIGLVLIEPVTSLIERGPLIWNRISWQLSELRSYLAGIEDIQREVSESLSQDEGGVIVVEDGETPGLTDALSFAPSLLAQLMIFVGVLFFFILSRDEIYHRIARIARTREGREGIAERFMRAERQVARYFLTISIINATLGLATAAAMMALGMPSPAVWGLLAAALNFIPYLGPAVMTALLLVGGLYTFNDLFVLVPALTFVAMNVLEGQFLTPALIGHQMTVNPLLVFVSLVFWIWLWGPIGGFVAIPILLMVIAFLTDAAEAPQPAPAPSAP